MDAGGAALRYGGLYGSPDDAQLELVRARRFPIVGDDGGVTSFVHLDDAASATVLALEAGATGVFNVSTTSRPRRAVAPAARGHDRRQAPRRIPRWLARLVTGDAGIVLLTWRRGFVASYGSA